MVTSITWWLIDGRYVTGAEICQVCVVWNTPELVWKRCELMEVEEKALPAFIFGGIDKGNNELLVG